VSRSVTDREPAVRRVYYHDPAAPPATVVVPAVVVAVPGPDGTLLLVRRCDSGGWELPGGRVDVGESAAAAAVRETAEESGVLVTVTGLIGVHSDPGYVVRSPAGEVRQPFVLLLRGREVGGTVRADLHETSDARWFAPAGIAGLPVEPAARVLIEHALAAGPEPHIH